MNQPGTILRATRRRGAVVASRVLQSTSHRTVAFVGAGVLALALGAGAVTVIEVSEQTAREASVLRRADGWKATKVFGAKAKLTLKSLKLALPLSAVYEGV